MIDVLDESASTIRKNLIRFRNDIEICRGDENMKPERRQILELTIETVQMLHYATFICSTLEKILNREELLKKNMKKFKEANLTELNRVDIIFLGYLYKIPRLILVKRGFGEELTKLKENKKTQSKETDKTEKENENDPD